MNVSKNLNTKRRKSVMLSSKIGLESLKSSEIKDEKENQKKNIKSRKSVQLKRQMTIQEDNSEKTLKRRASLTSSVEQIKVSQLAKRRSSYSDLFLLKLNYIPNDFSLSQKPESGYSNLYKNGIRVFDELDKENSNSFKSSFTLSNNISKTSLDKKYMRRSSLQPNFFRNQNFDFLNCGDDSLGNKYDKNNTGKSTRNLSKKKKHKKKKKNNSSYSESNSDSSNSGSDISSNSNSDIEEKARKKLGLFEKERELKKNNSDKIEGKALRNSFQEHNNNNEIFSHRKNRKNKTVRLNGCEERIKYLLGNGSIIKDHVNNQIIKEVEEEYEDGRLSNNILSNSLKNTKGNFWKRDLLKEQLDKINEMEDEVKKLILKKNHSFNNIKTKNVEEMILDKKDFYKFFHRSKSLGNILIKNKRYNMNNIENIIKKNKELNSKIYNKDLKGEEYKKLKLDGITYDETANNTNEKVNSPSSLLKLNPDELNSSEIKKKNGESFFTKGKISFLEIENDNKKNYSKIFKKNYLNNINNSEKKKEDDSYKIINDLLNKIKSKNTENKNILNLYKEENEKELEHLKKQKEEIKERKIQFSKEKKEKENEKIKQYSEKRNRNKNKIFENVKFNSKTIATTLPIYPNYENKTKLNENTLEFLSEPILTSKENNLMSFKHSLNETEILSPKKETDSNNLNEDNLNNIIDNENIISSNISLNIDELNNLKSINNKSIQDNIRNKPVKVKNERKYLNMLKNDMLGLNQRKNTIKKPWPFNIIQLKKCRKDYIMPVNDMDDVIEINNVYMSLNESLNVLNKKN